MSSSRLVSVVVCVRNREVLLRDALHSIVLNEPGEIIVIDDQSTDRSGEVAREFTDRVYRSEGKGLAAARQQGAELATCPYLAYIDSDVTLEEGCLEAMASFLQEHADYGSVQARTVTHSHSYWARDRMCRESLRESVREYQDGWAEGAGVGPGVAFRRELILEHKYDPFFVGSGEDIDLARRIRQAGWSFAKVDKVATHHTWSSFPAMIKQHIWYGRGSVRTGARGYASSRRRAAVRSESSFGRIAWLKVCVRHRRLDVIPVSILSSVAHYLGVVQEVATQRLDARRGKRGPV